MNWIDLTSEDQLDTIKNNSLKTTQVIFKHSTRCSISSMAKSRLDKGNAPENAQFHYLDLIRFRNISNKIVETFRVPHESPQVLLIKDGACIYAESHSGITMQDIEAHI